MTIGDVDLRRSVFIVAEIGNNHEGDIARAREMVMAAAEAGADAVKLQTFRTEHYVSRSDQARFARLKGFELSTDTVLALAELAAARGVKFLSTPFDLGSVATLAPIVDAYKIASGDIAFFPLLSAVARTGKPVILSTGASDLTRIDRAIEALSSEWQAAGRDGEVAILHCVSAYPVPEDQANLLAIRTLAERYPHPVGYSDHTIDIFAPIAAVALGARLIEKHFTLKKTLSDFRDHQLSAEPAEFQALVKAVRSVSAMLGTGVKTLQPCERDMPIATGRSIVATRDLPAGHVVDHNDLTWVRPAGGLAPGDEAAVIGRVLTLALRCGDRVMPEHLR
ncbi:unnamed protein product [uncultured bacterium]|nr:unnamed protein product [uncultured bacterium]